MSEFWTLEESRQVKALRGRVADLEQTVKLLSAQAPALIGVWADGGKRGISTGTVQLSNGHNRFVIVSESGTRDSLVNFSGAQKGQVFAVIADSGDQITVDKSGNIICPNAANIILRDDKYTIFYFDGENYFPIGNVVHGGSIGVSSPDIAVTVNFDNSMSAGTINDIIEATDHYIPPNVSLVFQFADGVYDLSTALNFSGFYGGGSLRIQGNQSESATTNHVNQAVSLDFYDGGNNDCNGLQLYRNNVYVNINNIKITTQATSRYGIIGYYNNAFIMVQGCYFTCGGSVSGSYGIFAGNGGQWRVAYCEFRKHAYAIMCAYGTFMYCYSNDDYDVQPVYGQRAHGGTMHVAGSIVTGSTASKYETNGGEIWE